MSLAIVGLDKSLHSDCSMSQACVEVCWGGLANESQPGLPEKVYEDADNDADDEDEHSQASPPSDNQVSSRGYQRQGPARDVETECEEQDSSSVKRRKLDHAQPVQAQPVVRKGKAVVVRKHSGAGTSEDVTRPLQSPQQVVTIKKKTANVQKNQAFFSTAVARTPQVSLVKPTSTATANVLPLRKPAPVAGASIFNNFAGPATKPRTRTHGPGSKFKSASHRNNARKKAAREAAVQAEDLHLIETSASSKPRRIQTQAEQSPESELFHPSTRSTPRSNGLDESRRTEGKSSHLSLERILGLCWSGFADSLQQDIRQVKLVVDDTTTIENRPLDSRIDTFIPLTCWW